MHFSTASALGIAMYLATLTGPQIANAEVSSRTLFDFTTAESARQWSNVNDGVMGGISEGRHRIRGEKLEFFGNLSLANNGGFASVRSRDGRLNLRGGDNLVIRVRGDGRRYYLNLRVPNNRMAFSYRVSFQTKAGEWQTFRVPLSEFRATSYGRVVRKAPPVDTKSVNSIGFMIADKVAGPFELEVEWIKVESPPVETSA